MYLRRTKKQEMISIEKSSLKDRIFNRALKKNSILPEREEVEETSGHSA